MRDSLMNIEMIEPMKQNTLNEDGVLSGKGSSKLQDGAASLRSKKFRDLSAGSVESSVDRKSQSIGRRDLNSAKYTDRDQSVHGRQAKQGNDQLKNIFFESRSIRKPPTTKNSRQHEALSASQSRTASPLPNALNPILKTSLVSGHREIFEKEGPKTSRVSIEKYPIELVTTPPRGHGIETRGNKSMMSGLNNKPANNMSMIPLEDLERWTAEISNIVIPDDTFEYSEAVEEKPKGVSEEKKSKWWPQDDNTITSQNDKTIVISPFSTKNKSPSKIKKHSGPKFKNSNTDNDEKVINKSRIKD